MSKVPGTGQRNRKGALSGADFGFWRPSAREERRRLGRFRGRGRLICAKSTQRTILVVSIHPPASPAIGRICRVLCMQVDEQSEQETHVNTDRAAESDRRMLEGACPASNSRCAAAHQHTATCCMSIRTNSHTLTCAPTQARTRTRSRVRAHAPPCRSEHASLE